MPGLTKSPDRKKGGWPPGGDHLQAWLGEGGEEWEFCLEAGLSRLARSICKPHAKDGAMCEYPQNPGKHWHFTLGLASAAGNIPQRGNSPIGGCATSHTP